MKIPAIILSMLATAFIAGCANEHHGYVSPTDIDFGSPDDATLSDTRRIASALVKKILSNDRFLRNYEERKKALGGELPVLQIGKFDNDVKEGDTSINPRSFTPKMEDCRMKVEEELENSGLFRFVNDENSYGSDSEDLNTGLQKGVEEGLTPGRNIQNPEEYLEADYRMLGTLIAVDDGNRHSFVLSIRVYSHKNRQRWTFSETITKE